ncbi:hypothetical protein CLHUN_01610 [Ruminiclostridium hungatei]|uniref:Uncharacterized protein n=1 Tax=Ruminiclostridium hungatei TaxID=48256 RepID=A0A1V4SSC0_RUMHU|nr:hypothetical protein [Ruminiclostridium hungatei]OPX46345.1 hypothetical protein CLHUN_01610 [Ruminiclostridium hungatei]
MKHECDGLKTVTQAIQKQFSDYENIEPPIELFSGQIYLNFTADKPFRGKKKQVEIPVLLSKCPFCGEKYTSKEVAT